MYFVLLSSITEQAHLLFLLSNNDSVSRDNNEEGLSWILYFASTPTKKNKRMLVQIRKAQLLSSSERESDPQNFDSDHKTKIHL